MTTTSLRSGSVGCLTAISAGRRAVEEIRQTNGIVLRIGRSRVYVFNPSVQILWLGETVQIGDDIVDLLAREVEIWHGWMRCCDEAPSLALRRGAVPRDLDERWRGVRAGTGAVGIGFHHVAARAPDARERVPLCRVTGSTCRARQEQRQRQAGDHKPAPLRGGQCAQGLPRGTRNCEQSAYRWTPRVVTVAYFQEPLVMLDVRPNIK